MTSLSVGQTDSRLNVSNLIVVIQTVTEVVPPIEFDVTVRDRMIC